jgi:hypothetical protein
MRQQQQQQQQQQQHRHAMPHSKGMVMHSKFAHRRCAQAQSTSKKQKPSKQARLQHAKTNGKLQTSSKASKTAASRRRAADHQEEEEEEEAYAMCACQSPSSVLLRAARSNAPWEGRTVARGNTLVVRCTVSR